MSVSLLMLPFALALAPVRLMLGAQRFEEWVRSAQIRIPATFRDEKDLLVTVRKAGYDAERWGGSIKTHVRGGELFLFWECVDGAWTAVFAKSDSQAEIKKFIQDLEQKAGRRLFRWSDGAQQVAILPHTTYPTDFRDKDLLVVVLEELGPQPVQRSDGAIVAGPPEAGLIFCREQCGAFNVQVVDPLRVDSGLRYLRKAENRYRQLVLAQTCERVKARATAEGLAVESEEVLEDQSIVITLTVRR